ncbi:MAG: hypothetical protein AAF401_03955 [Pseudomonadota bacterium]
MLLARDIYFLLLLPFLTLIAWASPRSFWSWLARLVSRFTSGLFIGGIPRRTKRLSRRFKWPANKAKGLLRALAGEQLIWLLEIIAMNRPGACPARIDVEGAEGPLSAVAEGRGAILWWSPSAHRDLVAKIGLAEAGLEIVHLSRPGHGISSSKIGRRVLNPLVTRQEMKWLKDRAVIDPANPVGATLKLRKTLKKGGCVAVAAAMSRHRGASTPIRARFMNGRFPFAPGAATLAEKTGAALYPVVTFRQDGGYRIIVGPDLNADKAGKPRRMVRRFARWNEPQVERAPEQWAGWLQI